MVKQPSITVLHEDNHILVVNKPAGILSQGDMSGAPSMVEMVREYIRITYNKPGNVFTGLVHRLDRPVSGVMVFARTSKAARRLHGEFSGRSVGKFYTALVPVFKEKMNRWYTLEDRLERIKDKTVVRETGPGRSSNASLLFYPALSSDRSTLLVIKLLTGRKHQIRAQLSHLGYPVIGDGKYGSREPSPPGSIMLHALFLKFRHPTEKRDAEFYAGLPPRMQSIMPGHVDLEGMIQDIIRNSAAG